MMEYSDTHIVILDTVVKKSDDKNNLLVEMYTNPQTPTITGISIPSIPHTQNVQDPMVNF